ncbi:HSP70/90 family co-chaperone CNS1 Ecym_2559 [Eremothecium cymbalariae DBVPG|uniref:Cns1/TTC4 wheel domain-containing protein n=1 Tax=Eremothecium cymbalariae (strain CBS 270.75 / DBVPG 7215 / KCTC 17166 / NRRL Y-17582) TaxID=931890 RepID=G8JQC0_ERECY|nr:Hypothetical protein Ecym_2559 [Eremothecium cymbalariae DBVPG\
MNISEYQKPRKYRPGPGDPQLPPQLTEFHDKTTDEVLKELNKMPFFMTKLDNADVENGGNVELEALKALAYEGEPHEVAANFKNQGNDLYKVKRYKDARTMYSKGIEVKCEDDSINGSLYLNRAACELELRNFRSCINDCKKALNFNAKCVKAFYRMGQAYFKLKKLEEAKGSVLFGLKLDSQNNALVSLLDTIVKQEEKANVLEESRFRDQQEKDLHASKLKEALSWRKITEFKTANPPAVLQNSTLMLSEPEDIESQLSFPAMVYYPTINEFDFVETVSEFNTPRDLLEMLLHNRDDWVGKPGYENWTPSDIWAYMETDAGKLVKIGKRVQFYRIFMMEKPLIPLFDNALRIYLVPKNKAKTWLEGWM